MVAGVEVAITTHTGVAEEVLILQVGSITPTEHLECDQVLLSRLQVAGEVELSLQFAILAVAHVLSVHPQIHVGGYGAEVRHDLLAFPVGGHHDLPAVGTDMILFGRHLRRVVLELLTPSVAHIDIDRVAIAIKFPYGGHLHVVPSLVVIAYPPEVGRTSLRITYPEEFPSAVECHEVG